MADNGLLVGLQHAWEPVGTIFKDKAGSADFSNHGGGVVFQADGTIGTGRVAITPGDGTSWLELARPSDDPTLHLQNSLVEEWTIAAVLKMVSLPPLSGNVFLGVLDWGNEYYCDFVGPFDFHSLPPYAPISPSIYALTPDLTADLFENVLDIVPNHLSPAVGDYHVLIATASGIGGGTIDDPSYVPKWDNSITDFYAGYQADSGGIANDSNPLTIGQNVPFSWPGNVGIAGLYKWGRVLTADEQTAFFADGIGLPFSQFDSGGGGGNPDYPWAGPEGDGEFMGIVGVGPDFG